MFKKSILIIIIQSVGALLGLLTIYFIAGDMAPEIYSLTGICTVVIGISTVFTHLGIETVMMREALYWIETGNQIKVNEHVTQALVSRIMAFIVLLPFLSAYLIYVNYTKYDGQYGILFTSFVISGFCNALVDSMKLMIQSQGGYVFAQTMNTVNTTVIKFLGIFIFILWGDKAYLYFYALSVMPILIVYIIVTSKNISLKYINIREMLTKIKESRYLWIKTDLDYFKNNADSLLVSALFPATIMGSYTVFKHLEQLMKSFIEGFFDVLSQNTVKYKGKEEKLIEQEKKIKLARNIVIGIICIGMLIYGLNIKFFINLINLSRYEHIGIMIMCVAVLGIVYLIGKYEINAIALFATSKTNFLVGLLAFAGAIVSYGVVIIRAMVITILLQKVFVYLWNSIVAIVIFRRQKKSLYMMVNK